MCNNEIIILKKHNFQKHSHFVKYCNEIIIDFLFLIYIVGLNFSSNLIMVQIICFIFFIIFLTRKKIRGAAAQSSNINPSVVDTIPFLHFLSLLISQAWY